MPYIKLNRRPALDPIIEALQKRLREQGSVRGEVNYTVTRIALGVLAATPSYQNYSDAIAALQDAADEIKRRCLSRYEDFACDTNGDVVEFVEADNDISNRWDALITAKLDDIKPLNHLPVVDVVIRDGVAYNVVDSPLPQVAADQYQKLQDEIKETFERR